jgi:hypothetical protein
LRLQIERLASADVSERDRAVEAIEHMSNPRWLGDLYLESLTLNSWWGLLNKAAEFAKTVAKRSPHRR